MVERLRSLELISGVTESEEAAQHRHADALDARAGILLGFSGALAAIDRTGDWVADVGRAPSFPPQPWRCWRFSRVPPPSEGKVRALVDHRPRGGGGRLVVGGILSRQEAS
jgi:hypothetical protein